ncbi:AB-hydrolase lipase domain [Trinorchestia longiramus]|nr:AB-hydrolase lipase domain [Trinorchestia longiramus]
MAEAGVMMQLLQILTQCSTPQHHLVLPTTTYDKTPPVPELIEGQGYPIEVHQVVTADGYVLSMHRIPYGLKGFETMTTPASNDTDDSSIKRPVAFLHHGLTSSSADYVMNLPGKALAYRLADSGYDVWMANCRGNQYSRVHESLDVEGAEYWNFSWDQIAAFDVPAEIDYVLNVTGQEQVNYVGFSMGTTVFFAAMNDHPDLMPKIKVMAAMAPVAYLKHVQGLAKLLSHEAELIDMFLHLLGVHYVVAGGDAMDAWITKFCGQPYSPKMSHCVHLLSMIVGPEHREMDQETLPLALIETPSGASPHTLLHYAQLILSGGFRKFDYGTAANNRAHYGQKSPPHYYPNSVTVPVALFNGDNDYLAPPKDVERLRNELPNVIFHKEISNPHFNHLDFLCHVPIGCGPVVPAKKYPFSLPVDFFEEGIEKLVSRYDECLNRFRESAEKSVRPCSTFASCSGSWLREHPDLGSLTTPELIEAAGYVAETHHVTTEDGYILELHRIPYGVAGSNGEVRPVAFLQHCLLCSSSDYLMNEPDKALAYILADTGFDVWLGNYRGNTYSRNHVTLDPDEDLEFWSFSWDEMGIIDLPTMIDYTLEATGQKDLYYVGFSMGTTTYYAMLSEKPEYNNKLRVAINMAPVAYMEHMKGPLTLLAPYSDQFDTLLTLLGKGEFLPSRDVTDELVEQFCDEEMATAEVCYNVLFLIAGPDPDLINEEWLPVILAHTPAGTSVHTINHYAQLYVSKEFTKYDYGPLGNSNHYGQTTPPSYNLSNVITPTALFWGSNDWLAAPEDVARLAPELPNLILDYRVPFDKFNHLDFVWAVNASDLVYDAVLEVLAEY